MPLRSKKIMTSRERVKRAIRFEKPDLIPIDYWILPATILKYKEKLLNLFKKYPKDFPDNFDYQDFSINLPPSHKKGYFTDAFGCVWRNEYDGFMGQIEEHPLKNLEDIKNYKFPDYDSGEITLKQIKENINKWREKNKYLCCDFIRTFERMHFLRGMENLLIDMAYEKEEFFILLERVVEWNMKHLELVLAEDVDGIWFSDDWGTQNSLLINPETWRKIFKPYYKKMFDLVKKSNKDIFFHSDGYILEIIPDLIEIGADVLNCQIKLLNAKRLSERFGGKITFHTDFDRQNILPYGTKEDIREHIKDAVDNFGKYSGGLILNAEIGPDIPYQNIEILFEEFEKVKSHLNY
jgi:uroporphyrinogen decarboxylase